MRFSGGFCVITVIKEGPADLAGVFHNDRIVEVNGTNVEEFDHDQVVKLIIDSGDKGADTNIF